MTHLRMWDPVTLLVAKVGGVFTQDSVVLCNWNRFLQNVLLALGSYLFLRKTTSYLGVRLVLIPVLLFSSQFFGSFFQNGSHFNFLWVPFVFYFLNRIFFQSDPKWNHWAGLSVFTGLSWQSYNFAGTWVFLFFFGVGLVLFHREKVRSISPSMLVLFAGINLLLLLPNLTLLLENNHYSFPARLSYSGAEAASARLSADALVSGGHFYPLFHFLKLFFLPFDETLKGPLFALRNSDTYLYLGLIVPFVALIGLINGKDSRKRLFLVVLAGTALLMIGPAYYFYWVLQTVYPPLWFFRHVSHLTPLFGLVLIYFFILGLHVLVESKRIPIRREAIHLSLTLFFTITAIGLLVVDYQEGTFRGLIFWAVLGFCYWAGRKLTRTQLTTWALFFPGFVVLLFCSSTYAYAIELFLKVGIPLATLFLLTRNQHPRRQTLFLSILFLVLNVDLLQAISKTKHLYGNNLPGLFSPTPSLEFKMERETERLYTTITREVLYYPELVAGGRYALSTTYPPDTSYQSNLSLAQGHTFLILNSYWNVLRENKEGSFLDNYFGVHQPRLHITGGEVEIKSYQPNRLSLSVAASKPTSIQWHDAPHGYWKAKVNNEPVAINRENFAKTVALPEGESLVTFIYEPPFLKALIVYYLIGFLGIGVSWIKP